MEPSVKGTIFQNLVNELNEARAQGTLNDEDLNQELKPGEIEQLDEEVMIASWYPADTYCRMLRLLAHSAGTEGREAMIESGRRSARRVIEMGIYSQLDGRTEESWQDRVGRLLCTLSSSFFSFGRWEWLGVEADGKTIGIGVHEASPFSKDLILRTQGFVEVLATRAAGRRVMVNHSLRDGGEYLLYRGRLTD